MKKEISLRGWMPMLVMHAGCFSVLFVNVTPVAVILLIATYAIRVFALTAGFHRYFSHKAYRTSRTFQFILALVGGSAAQLDPLWWASHHRWHHRTADTHDDVHSPAQQGFWWSHLGWIVSCRYSKTRMELVKDFARYPELRWLNRYPYVPTLGYAALLLAAGDGLRFVAPGWRTSGAQFIAWGFFLSTVLVYHVTFCINSLMHMMGRRRFETPDTSRNCFWLAFLTMGEGWHNNHHHYAVCARQGFRWWELDFSYYMIRLLGVFRVVWDIREPPRKLVNGRFARATPEHNAPAD